MKVGLRPLARLSSWRRFARDEDASSAVEFAMVSIPFLMFIFALIGCALYFFVINSIEMGMDQSSRLIRTGQAISSNMTVKQFKQSICDGAGTWIQCNSLQIFVVHYADWSSVSPQACVDSNKNIITNPAPDDQLIAVSAGTASDVVIVTACYKWNFSSRVPYFKLGNMPDGSLMMQSATAFRSEPYTGS
jgi:Flp pilus assembly protein TadG